MSRVPELLRQVWQVFRKANIVDDLEIVEHIASLLLEGAQKEAPVRFARRGLDLPQVVRYGVSPLLMEAAAAAGGPGVLFNRGVLMRLPEMYKGGRYPTPRHVARTMAALVSVSGNDTVADFACGTGGFLVEARGGSHFGVEIAATWADLARVNLMLNDVEGKVRTADSLKEGLPAVGKGSYNVVLMNPPFTTMDGERYERPLRGRFNRSETAFLQLGLRNLARGGRLAMLVPSNLLTAGTKPEVRVRERLLKATRLKMVASLPPDSLQPFTTTPAYLVHAERRAPGDSVSWLVRLEHDGYDPGRSRNLVASDPTESSNELLRLPALLQCDPDAVRPLQTDKGVRLGELGKVSGEHGSFWVITLAPGLRATLVKRYGGGEGLAPHTFIQVANQEAVFQGTIGLETGGEPWATSETPELSAYRKIHGKAGTEKTPWVANQQFPLLARPHAGTIQVALTLEGAPFALGVVQRELAAAADLRPENYLFTPAEQEALKSPAHLLGSIYRKQRRLMQHIDRLLSRVEAPLPTGKRFPPALAEEAAPAGEIEPLQPLGPLSERQRALWQQVGNQTELITAESEAYLTPTRFSPEQLQEQGVADNNLEQMLELFRTMGALIPESDQGKLGYRLVTEEDIWDGRVPVPDTEEEL
ncbi:MAG: HsdM family class I SAM-dependent methyltransferase [Bacillota bacterium]